MRENPVFTFCLPSAVKQVSKEIKVKVRVVATSFLTRERQMDADRLRTGIDAAAES
jgi:hypothetical protein